MPATLRRKTAPQEDPVPAGSTCRTRDTDGLERKLRPSALPIPYGPPRPPWPNGEVPHCPSSKARPSRSTSRKGKHRRQGKRLRVREELSDAGNNALKDKHRATTEVIEETAAQVTNGSRRKSPLGEEMQPFQLPATFTTGTSRHHPLRQKTTTNNFRTPNAAAAQRPESGAFWSAGAAELGARP